MMKLKKNKQLYFHVWAANLMGMSYGEYMAFITDPVLKLSKEDFSGLVKAYYKDHKEDFEKKSKKSKGE